MSKEDMWKVIGRSRADLSFAGQLLGDFEKTLKDSGYNLERDEIETAKITIGEVSIPQPFSGIDWQFQQEKMKERLTAQIKRSNDLGEYTVQILKNTLNNAAYTYKTITWMNNIMFATGIALFIFAAIWGVISSEKIYSLVFGGLGAASFIALFMLGPIEKTQIALSNLVQVEVAFMDYFEQIAFWETFAFAPRSNQPGPPDPANIEKASAALQMRSKETIELLQTYVEGGTGIQQQGKEQTIEIKESSPI